jgi:nitrate/nitrite transporter NarK
VGPWWYTVRYLGGALADRAITSFLFFASLWAWITVSMMMTLLTNSGNDPPVLSAIRSYSLVERSIMKRSTWSGAYYVKWLNNLE